MSGTGRKEDEVRRMLDLPHPPVPADLIQRATERGTRLLHRHRVARRVMWTLLTAITIAFIIWASVSDLSPVPPVKTTPPLEGF